jgi:phytanoyl-CoA hydroxylase
VQPTAEQIEAYRRDGFVVLERFLDEDEVERLREHFAACFDHRWETGLRPDEVNYVPGQTPPDLTRQLGNAWKSDRTVAATVLAERNAEFGARLAGLPACGSPRTT